MNSFVKALITTTLTLSSPTQAYAPSSHHRAPPPSKATFLSSLSGKGQGDVSALNIELPNFNELFDKIQQVSPLAQSVMQGSANAEPPSHLQWKTLESNKGGLIREIEKLEQFGGISTPLFRFRSQLQGPCIGEFFGRFIIDLNERRKWDRQIEQVHELASIPTNFLKDLFNNNDNNEIHGKCVRMGLGYGQTKATFGITPREQMFLYGLQDFTDGSCLIWGTEMSEEYNHLLPQGPRHTRAKSHLFSAAMKPRNDGTFDIEYILQLDIGGSMPTWLTTPVLIDTVKSLFQTAQQDFGGATDSLQCFLQDKARDDTAFFRQHASLLIPH